jgi:hypothetical protein
MQPQKTLTNSQNGNLFQIIKGLETEIKKRDSQINFLENLLKQQE